MTQEIEQQWADPLIAIATERGLAVEILPAPELDGYIALFRGRHNGRRYGVTVAVPARVATHAEEIDHWARYITASLDRHLKDLGIPTPWRNTP